MRIEMNSRKRIPTFIGGNSKIMQCIPIQCMNQRCWIAWLFAESKMRCIGLELCICLHNQPPNFQSKYAFSRAVVI